MIADADAHDDVMVVVADDGVVEDIAAAIFISDS